MTPRPYQRAVWAEVKKAKAEVGPGVGVRGVVVLPTGTGKNLVMSRLAQAVGARRALYLAYTEEQVAQIERHLVAQLGAGQVGVELGSRKLRRGRPLPPHVVSTVPTMAALDHRRLDLLLPAGLDLVVLDEAHHGVTPVALATWRKLGLMSHDDESRAVSSPISLIGLTATKHRGDGLGLHAVFDRVLYEMSLVDAVRDGWLVPPEVWTVRTAVSLAGLRGGDGGDFVEQELRQRVAVPERTSAIYQKWCEHAAGLKTLVFCVGLSDCAQKVAYFRERGIAAQYVAGSGPGGMPTAQRRRILDWFRGTEGAVLMTADLLIEGVDVPSVEALVLGRPTSQSGRAIQMLGRGLRLAEGARDYADSVRLGKDRVVVLDVVDATGVADVVTVPALFGSPLPHREVRGQDVLSAVAEHEAVATAALVNLEATGVRADLVDFFAKSTAIPATCKLQWIEFGDGFRLHLPDHRVLRVSSDVLDRWVVTSFNRVSSRWGVVGEPRFSAVDAFRAAEQWVRERYRGQIKLLQTKARWRQKPPKMMQLERAHSLGVSVPPGATRGEVSDAISRRYAELAAGGGSQ